MPSAPIAASHRIADFVMDRRTGTTPAGSLHLARRALLDTLAGTLAARSEPAADILIAYALSLGNAGASTLWTTGAAASPEAAALANGSIGHLLDFDDVTSPMRGHPSVVIWPAVLALAEEENLGCRTALAAFATGLEVIAKLGRVVAIEHVAKGWHSTNTLGVLGATAACGQMLDMDREQIASALGLAVAMAAGTRANFGTMAKCFQAGQAAASALRAVGLARRGLTASPAALDGPSGFTSLYCQGESFAAELDGLGVAPLEAERSGLDVKRFPNCYATHRTIQATLELRSQTPFGLDDVDRIAVVTSARAQTPLVYPRPKTGLEGKFSLQYAVAAAIEDGAITLESFTDAMVVRPRIQAILPRIATREEDGSALPRWADISITLKNGTTLRRRTEILTGSAAAPLSDAQLVEKFRACCQFATYSGDVDAAANLILRMADAEDAPMRRVMPSLHALINN